MKQEEILVAYLKDSGDWMPTWALQSQKTPYGFIGSAGAVRARELARNDCAERYKDLVERERGKDIGLDPRYEYFRYKKTDEPQQLKLV